MMSRILFLDHVGALGGAELALLDVARAYRETCVFMLFSDGPFRDRLTEAGVRVEILEGGRALHAVRRETRFPGLGAGAQVARLAWQVARRARDFDVIHANSQKAFVVACVAGVIARRPVIWDLNDLLLPEHFSRTNIWIDVLLANHLAVRVIANSQASADALVHQGGDGRKVRVVYNGLDPAPFDAISDREVAALRADLGLEGVPLVGLFGRLAEWKGQHVALEAVATLPGVHLLLVGDALFGEQLYADRLHGQAARLGIGERVHFLGFRPDIPALMRLVDVVVHTSTAPEPFGRVIVEGMLARRPVVATRAGGVREIMADGQTGILVPPGDADALAKAINELILDKGRANRLAVAGRTHAEERFTVDAMVQAMSRNMEEVARA
ncbi:MAG TPA: glycosyltransferase family 4 protein [Gemmatimonadales bacterium]|nr:glycosyltransferase family 4 protein [Gemmatimonadales bacterium]